MQESPTILTFCFGSCSKNSQHLFCLYPYSQCEAFMSALGFLGHFIITKHRVCCGVPVRQVQLSAEQLIIKVPV